MTDIREEILKGYGFDIDSIDLISEYKIGSPDLSGEELEQLLDKKRKSWEKAAHNRYREDKARAAKERLEYADSYEAVLRNQTLLKALFAARGKEKDADYYVEFARQYFQLTAQGGFADSKDAEFFFRYYQGQIKNRKAILEMLEKEFGLKKKDSKHLEKEEEEEGEQKKKKEKQSRIIVSLFSAQTLYDLQYCFNKQEEARKSEKVCAAFPDVKGPMDVFLRLTPTPSLSQFKSYVEEQRTAVYNRVQEGQRELDCLVDLFNTLSGLLGHKDVNDNFGEFILLVRYNKFSPYMYELVAPTENTLRELFNLADPSYGFRSFEDFLARYFIPVYQNFGIQDDKIKKLIKGAQKSAKKAKRQEARWDYQEGQEAQAAEQEEKLSFFANLLFILANLPFYLTAGVFELTRFLVWKVRYVTILAAIPIMAWWLPFVTAVVGGYDTAEGYGVGLLSNAWNALRYMFGDTAAQSISGTVVLALALVLAGIIPVILVVQGFWRTGTQMRKEIDWLGIKRTNQSIVRGRKKKFAKKLREAKGAAVTGFLIAAVMNILLLGGIGYGVGITGQRFYRQYQISQELARNRREARKARERREAEEASEEETNQEADSIQDGGSAVITASAANVRAGAGTDWDVVTVAPQGSRFALTGNSQTLESGSVWYEIDLDESGSQTGWVSQTVINLEMHQ